MNSEMNDVTDYIFGYWYRNVEHGGTAWLELTGRLDFGACLILTALAALVSIWWYGILASS